MIVHNSWQLYITTFGQGYIYNQRRGNSEGVPVLVLVIVLVLVTVLLLVFVLIRLLCLSWTCILWPGTEDYTTNRNRPVWFSYCVQSLDIFWKKYFWMVSFKKIYYYILEVLKWYMDNTNIEKLDKFKPILMPYELEYTQKRHWMGKNCVAK